MTDNEIIKALECCANCEDCFYGITNCPLVEETECRSLLAQNSLDLITRQQSKNKRLGKEVDLVSIQFQDLQERYEEAQAEIEQWKEEANKYQKLWCIAMDDIEIAQSEAIKEFAERLKDDSFEDKGYYYDIILVTDIDDVLKEMIGETE